MIALIVGIITNRVRNNAIPISTWLGGVVGVPSALRTKLRTMRILVNPVTVKRIAGRIEIPPMRSRIWSALLESIFTSEP